MNDTFASDLFLYCILAPDEREKFVSDNPVIGIAVVSCVPTTARVAQKEVHKVNPQAMIMAEALGANIRSVITTAIIAGLYITFFS